MFRHSKRSGDAMGRLTTHVLNLAAGIPAAGMRIDLRAVTDGIVSLENTALTDADGRCTAPLVAGTALRVGKYSLTFHVAAYFRALGTPLADPPFLDEVVIAFGLAEATQNYHVPLLVSPWSYSTYRGS